MSSSSSSSSVLSSLTPLERAMPLIESVQCAHWARQRVLVALGADCVAKLTPADDDCLQWERRFVPRVLNYLLEHRVTPCVTRYYDSVHCSPQSPHAHMLWRRVRESGERERRASAHAASPPPTSAPTAATTPSAGPQALVGFVVERARGVPLHQWAQQPHSLRQWRYVLFQLLYTVDAMRALGIRHNDLHWDNVFVDERGWPQSLAFRLPSSTAKSPRAGGGGGGDIGAVAHVPAGREAPAVRIIDFDKASLSGARVPHAWSTADNGGSLHTNPTLETTLCTSYGLCNRDDNDKYDAHTALCYIMYGATHYRYRVPNEVQQWVQREAMPVGRHLYETDFHAAGGYTCRLGKPFCAGTAASSSSSYRPTDDEQRPTLHLLRHSSLFAPLFAQEGTMHQQRQQQQPQNQEQLYVHPEA